MRLTRFFFCLISSALGASAAWPLPDFLPSDTSVLIGTRVSGLKSLVSDGALPAEINALAAEWTQSAGAAHFDWFRDLDEVLITVGEGAKDPPTLVVLRGRFDVTHIPGIGSYKGVPLLALGQSKDSAVAVLDEHTAICGTDALVRAAIDRRGRGAVATELAASAVRLAGKYDIWAVGRVPAGLAGDARAAATGLNAVDRFEVGVLCRHDLEVQAELHARSAKQLQELESTLRVFSSMMAGSQSGASKIDIHAGDGAVKLSLFVPEAELKRAVSAGRSAASAHRSAPVSPPVQATGIRVGGVEDSGLKRRSPAVPGAWDPASQTLTLPAN